ncbi:MAG: MBOAT family protein [Candidatus Omnitrophica bacterium]|nr:MBOAT family protein [Candidatus Omnitrophota bacterium]MCG2704844.1 MBOAT family protein [Candidatus Omnitrophota bacterium]
MAFNSLQFVLFFVIVYILYLASGLKWQNKILLAASYVFYAFWDWRFLSIILVSTLFNYYGGLKIDEVDRDSERKKFLILSVCLNLGLLGFFKYYDFFAGSLQTLLWSFGWRISKVTLNIVLPLGISFYTFQAMSYPIDIYRRVIKPTRHFLDFALFVAFFPQLVAGPIERARNMLPQIQSKRHITLDQFYTGCWLIFWGLFKKIVVADNLAKVAGRVFGAQGAFTGIETLIATYAFVFQIYADFSGYSDMARGLARLMGFNIMINFRVPFFASNLYDFWQRWHISLTTWIKEYLFYPLALAKFLGRQLKPYSVVIITWAIMGFWHGPAGKFILWGVYHGVLIVLFSKIRPYLKLIRPQNRLLAGSLLTGQILTVFHLFCIGILFFAAESTAQAFGALYSIFFNFKIGHLYTMHMPTLAAISMCIFPMMLIEYFQYRTNDEMVVFRWPAPVRGLVYYVILYLIIFYGDFGAQKYYYFQF